MIDVNKKYSAIEPFIFAGSSAPSSGSNGQILFQIGSEYDYFLTGFAFQSSVGTTALTATFDVQIMKNDRAVFFDFAPSDSFFGTYINTIDKTRVTTNMTRWYRFPKPYKFDAKSNLILNLKNTSGATNTIRITTDGYRAFLR